MDVDEALHALRAPDQRSMGRAMTSDMGEVTSDRIAAVELFAQNIRAWNPSIIPGLLQTTRYAAGAIKTVRPALPAVEVQHRAYGRAERIQAFLARWKAEDVGQAWFIIGEDAIVQPLMNAHAHAHQLMHLLNLSNRDKIQIQVMPRHIPTPGRVGQFVLYRLEGDRRLAYFETLPGLWYTTRSEDLARVHAAFSDMIGKAYTPAESRTFIAEVLGQCWGPTEEPSSSSPATATTPTATASQSPALPPGTSP